MRLGESVRMEEGGEVMRNTRGKKVRGSLEGKGRRGRRETRREGEGRNKGMREGILRDLGDEEVRGEAGIEEGSEMKMVNDWENKGNEVQRTGRRLGVPREGRGRKEKIEKGDEEIWRVRDEGEECGAGIEMRNGEVWEGGKRGMVRGDPVTEWERSERKWVNGMSVPGSTENGREGFIEKACYFLKTIKCTYSTSKSLCALGGINIHTTLDMAWDTGSLSHALCASPVDPLFMKTLLEHNIKSDGVQFSMHNIKSDGVQFSWTARSSQWTMHAAQNKRLRLRVIVQVLFSDHVKISKAIASSIVKETGELTETDAMKICTKSFYLQMLYEFNIMSTSLPDINHPNLAPEYQS
ncbi:hypothetical protein Tco_0890301 [Tanacetum coccineum]|uniref:Uncharacterized protein n=1 Tax=Tanacetum coccineum TaxID=301880 RepID=A0ABQ5C5K8_9ASTR